MREESQSPGKANSQAIKAPGNILQPREIEHTGDFFKADGTPLMT
jgi:hypothetical protein